MEHFEKFESYIPVDLMDFRFFLLAIFLVFTIVVFRYFLTAGIFWWMFYRWQPESLKNRRIYKQLPSNDMQKYEIRWSMMSSLVFALSAAFLGLMWQAGWTKFYLKINQYGWFYFFASLFLYSLVHEVYFYWTHRWLHIPAVFKKFHAVHHQSLTPSPWASFSFHPVEALIQALALPLIVLVIPIHPVAFLVYLTLMSLSAVTNHLGFEILPRRSENNVARFLISGVHHTMHHKYYRANFGLFYTFCDHLFKTEHQNFNKDFQHAFEKKS